MYDPIMRAYDAPSMLPATALAMIAVAGPGGRLETTACAAAATTVNAAAGLAWALATAPSAALVVDAMIESPASCSEAGLARRERRLHV